jgi:DNA repair photolyase
MSDTELLRIAPSIPWNEPYTLWQNRCRWYGCRYCYATSHKRSLDNPAHLFPTLPEFERHVSHIHKK